jgi:vancomycin aglycone glucosyltransferase
MRVLLTTIGSRGDVQPLVAVATRLRESGHEARLCVPPDFRDWVEGLGFPITPVGASMREARTYSAVRQVPPPPDELRQMAEATLADQFPAVAEAAKGCDIIVAVAGRRPFAARSVAETLGIRYVFAAITPPVLPSEHYAPPPLPAPGGAQPFSAARNRELWSRRAGLFNTGFGPVLNRHRASAGLAPVDDVLSHVFTSRPWLAADPVLAPWPGQEDGGVFQTGAWMLPDERPLSRELEEFLAAGEPPVYFGFGSTPMPSGLDQVIVQVVRRTGRRAIISAGWTGLTLTGSEPGCLVIGEVNLQKLFQKVAAVVHHGGAGTTTLAAIAGTPQVAVPQSYEQNYWARCACQAGIAVAHVPGMPTADSLTAALEHALRPGLAARARSVSLAMNTDGARTAAASLIAGTRDSA